MSWTSRIIKNNPVLGNKNKPTIDLSRLRKPPVKPKKSCVQKVNEIVDYILSETNRIEASSDPLWNTGKREGPHTTTNMFSSDGWYNIWTYYFTDESKYNQQEYYSHALFMAEHTCWYAEDEEAACEVLKVISKANVQPQREMRERGTDPLPQLEYGLELNNFHLQNNIFANGKNGGAIQISAWTININNHPYIQNMSDEDKQKYMPALTRVLKEHDEMFKKVLQMAKDAVADLKL